MSGFAAMLAEDRRLIILRSLADVPNYRLNEQVLQTGLNAFGHHAGRDLVRADILYLAEHGLVRVEKLPAPGGELWLAALTAIGEDVANGRLHPGVARPRPA